MNSISPSYFNISPYKMIISLRTMINTTLFRAFVLIVFRVYTRRDQTPAQKIFHYIGWDNIGNLTITVQEDMSISGYLLEQKITNIENLIQATNMNCLLHNAGTTIGTSTYPTPQSTIIDTTTKQNLIINSIGTGGMIKLVIFNTIIDSKLPELNRLNISSLDTVDRPIVNSNTIVEDIISMMSNITLTAQEKANGYVSLFDGEQIRVIQQEFLNGKLSLTLSGVNILSPAKYALIRESIRRTFTQFPEVKEVIFQ